MRKFRLAAMIAAALSFSGVASAGAATVSRTGFAVVEHFAEPPGVFTSDGRVVCATGTTSNVTRRTDFGQGLGVFSVLKTITCDDGSGRFNLQISAFTGFTKPAGSTFGPWVVRSGTGRYRHLRGAGRVVGTPIPGGISDVYSGVLIKS